MFPNLQSLDANIKLVDASPELVKEIQSLLAQKNFYAGAIDGIPGKLTQEGFAKFKKSVWLSDPEILGKSSALALLEIAEKHQVIPEQMQAPTRILVEAGSNSGRSMRLLTGETVYQNQWIVPGIPLTWGEMTRNCYRVPESKQVIENIFKTAKGFGEIREKYGKPLGVTSGYRPPLVNQAVGGARRSQHILGLGIDICPLDGNLYKLFEVAIASSAVGIGRGMHRGFVHCDWRGGGRVVFNYWRQEV